jgi:hypothetical protein
MLAPRLGFEPRFTPRENSDAKHVCFGWSLLVNDLFCKADSNHPLCPRCREKSWVPDLDSNTDSRVGECGAKKDLADRCF